MMCWWGVAATIWIKLTQVPKFAAVAALGLLKRIISPWRPKPTQRLPAGSSAAEFGNWGLFPGNGQPVWLGNVSVVELPPSENALLKSKDPLPPSPLGE